MDVNVHHGLAASRAVVYAEIPAVGPELGGKRAPRSGHCRPERTALIVRGVEDRSNVPARDDEGVPRRDGIAVANRQREGIFFDDSSRRERAEGAGHRIIIVRGRLVLLATPLAELLRRGYNARASSFRRRTRSGR